MKKQKENSHEGITWSEMGKQNVQAEMVYCLKWKIYCDDHSSLSLIITLLLGACFLKVLKHFSGAFQVTKFSLYLQNEGILRHETLQLF